MELNDTQSVRQRHCSFSSSNMPAPSRWCVAHPLGRVQFRQLSHASRCPPLQLHAKNPFPPFSLSLPYSCFPPGCSVPNAPGTLFAASASRLLLLLALSSFCHHCCGQGCWECTLTSSTIKLVVQFSSVQFCSSYCHTPCCTNVPSAECIIPGP